MMQNLRTRAQSEEGFTLIELLVVILIIGILAAIALPTFLGQKDKAKDASVKSDVRNAVSQMESCLVDGIGTPPVATSAACAADPGVAATGVTVTGGADEFYTVGKASTSSAGTIFKITKPTGGGFIRCSTAGIGTACAGASTW